MKIYLTSVYVDDQEKALRFYTDILGFVKKQDFPVGEFKWLTVVSLEELDGVQLVLEPNANPASKQYQRALFEQGIAATSFAVSDIQREYARMTELGVVWTQAPTEMGPAIVAVFNDTCGNLIQLAQKL